MLLCAGTHGAVEVAPLVLVELDLLDPLAGVRRVDRVAAADVDHHMPDMVEEQQVTGLEVGPGDALVTVPVDRGGDPGDLDTGGLPGSAGQAGAVPAVRAHRPVAVP